MSPERPPSRANVALADYLTAHGLPTTARQVRSWSAQKWIARPRQRLSRHDLESFLSNSQELLRRAIAVAELRRGKRTAPHLIVLGLFARGFELEDQQLRDAYLTYFANLNRLLERMVPGLQDPLDRAEALAEQMVDSCGKSVIGRYLLKRSGQIGRTTEGVMQAALTLLCASFLGCDPEVFASRLPGSEVKDDDEFEQFDALDELLRITGLIGFHADRAGIAGPIVEDEFELRDDMLGFLSEFSLESLGKASQELPMEMLVEARDRLQVLVPFLKTFSRFVALSGGPRDAFGLVFATKLRLDEEATAVLSLMLARVEVLHPGAYEKLEATFQVGATKFAGASEVLQRMQPRLRRYLGASGEMLLAAAKPSLRDQLRNTLLAIRDADPELVEQATAPLPSVT